jgi:flagellar L-ring protein FlgH
MYAKPLPLIGALSLSAMLAACALTPDPVVGNPTTALPVQPPLQLEHQATGSLFQPHAPVTSLFTGLQPPRMVGDTLKVDISEVLSGSNKLASELSRSNSMSVKGPGQAGKVPTGLLRSLMDLDAQASGSDAFKGQGSMAQNSRLNGKIAVTVINVLANGNLVVAGERSIAFNKGVTTLKFSGVVNPHDIRAGNVVASADVVNARMEALGEGEAADSASRSWLQRLITRAFSVW